MQEKNNDNNDVLQIVIVEDSATYREALCMALGSEPDIRVVATYPNALVFLRELKDLPPSLVLMDINLPKIHGIEAVIRLKEQRPELDVMMLTVFDDGDSLFRSLRAGACGYLLKSASMAEILVAIRDVKAGGSPLTPRIARRVLTFLQEPEPTDMYILTKREEEILLLLADGKSHITVAAELHLSIPTVQTFIRKIYKKLHIHSRSELFRWLAAQRKINP
jgi:DNA-binding NarL/FixJ family response regulator